MGGGGWGLTRTVSSSNFKIASRTGNGSRLPNSMIAVLDHQGFTLKRADIWDSRNSAHDFCRDLSRLPRTPRVRSAPHRWVDPVHSPAARLINATVSSILLKDPHTFAPPLWKLLPSCALDVNDRRDCVAFRCSYAYHRAVPCQSR